MKVKHLLGFLGAALAVLASPLSAAVSVVNGLTHEKEAKPGEVYVSVIILQNISKEVREVRLYQTDYSFTADGKKFYDPPGSVKRSNAAWVSPDQRRVVLPPQGRVEVKYTTRVPSQPGLAGTYWSMIMIEESSPGEPAARAKGDKINVGIRQVMRSGIQVITHIGDTGVRDVKFLKTEVIPGQGGVKTIAIDVQNTGERWLRPYLTADLFNEKGVSLGRFDGGRQRLFPGTSARYTVEFGKIPDGRYRALIVLDNKDEYVFGTEYALNFGPAAPVKKK